MDSSWVTIATLVYPRSHDDFEVAGVEFHSAIINLRESSFSGDPGNHMRLGTRRFADQNGNITTNKNDLLVNIPLDYEPANSNRQTAVLSLFKDNSVLLKAISAGLFGDPKTLELLEQPDSSAGFMSSVYAPEKKLYIQSKLKEEKENSKISNVRQALIKSIPVLIKPPVSNIKPLSCTVKIGNLEMFVLAKSAKKQKVNALDLTRAAFFTPFGYMEIIIEDNHELPKFILKFNRTSKSKIDEFRSKNEFHLKVPGESTEILKFVPFGILRESDWEDSVPDGPVVFTFRAQTLICQNTVESENPNFQLPATLSYLPKELTKEVPNTIGNITLRTDQSFYQTLGRLVPGSNVKAALCIKNRKLFSMLVSETKTFDFNRNAIHWGCMKEEVTIKSKNGSSLKTDKSLKNVVVCFLENSEIASPSNEQLGLKELSEWEAGDLVEFPERIDQQSSMTIDDIENSEAPIVDEKGTVKDTEWLPSNLNQSNIDLEQLNAKFRNQQNQIEKISSILQTLATLKSVKKEKTENLLSNQTPMSDFPSSDLPYFTE
eukprot:GHVP01042138.1.p1 GENE.GHVP01042138.1~~GHVP01042138.1.p1  ORF type:complete len:546 (+),score=97.20 GHVP01042138.1:84-1721(+)